MLVLLLALVTATITGQVTLSGRVTGGAVATLTPGDIPGLVQWSVPENQGVSNGASVATILDYSGNGQTLTPVSTQATYATSGINGVGAFVFNGTSNEYSNTALSSTFAGSNTPFTWFGVVQHTSHTSAQCYMMVANITSGHSARPTLDICNQTFSTTVFAARATALWETIIQGGTLDLNPHVIVRVYDGTTDTLYMDGIQIAAGAATWGPLSFTSGAYTLGDHRRAGISDGFFHGKFGETGLISRAIDATELAGLQTYLHTKYSIAVPATPAWSPNHLFLVAADQGAWFRDDSFSYGITNGTTTTGWGNRVSVSWDYTVTPTYYRDFDSGPGCLYTTNIQNGKAACLFNGTTQYLTGNFGLAGLFQGTSTPFTYWIVAKPTEINFGAFFWVGQPSSPGIMFFYLPPTNYGIVRRDNTNHLVSVSANTPDTNVHLYEFSYSGTAMSIYVDGTVLTSFNAISFDTTTNAGNNNLGTLTLASTGSAGNPADDFYKGYIMEQGVLSRILTSPERTLLHTYAQSYWGTP